MFELTILGGLTFITLVISILPRQRSAQTLPTVPYVLPWIGAAIEKPIEVLLQYIARGCARMWLTKMSSLEGIFGFLNRYIHMVGVTGLLKTSCTSLLTNNSCVTTASMKRRASLFRTLMRLKLLPPRSGLDLTTTLYGMAVWHQRFATAVTTSSQDRKSTRLNSSHSGESRMPSSA